MAKSEEDLERCAEFFFDFFLEGNERKKKEKQQRILHDRKTLVPTDLGEPATKSKGGYHGFKHPEIRKHIMEVLHDGVSLMAVDDSNGFLAGIRTSYVIDRCVKTRRAHVFPLLVETKRRTLQI